jgi:4-hydroxy-tetrahydrodipicolinate reductase
MNIALIGYGKMGKAIEQVALRKGHQIVLKITTENIHELTAANLQHADVVIEFTRPEAAKEHVLFCLEQGIPVVCGTTGWNHHLYLAQEKAIAHNTAFLYASNFSIGVNIFFEINKLLAAYMNEQPTYEVSITETHHAQKKDAPSGTAITIAAQIMENMPRKKHWSLAPAKDSSIIPITAHREDQITGTHVVSYQSMIDTLEIKHVAHSREGFAVGAVMAAAFIRHRSGIFSMADVLRVGGG